MWAWHEACLVLGVGPAGLRWFLPGAVGKPAKPWAGWDLAWHSAHRRVSAVPLLARCPAQGGALVPRGAGSARRWEWGPCLACHAGAAAGARAECANRRTALPWHHGWAAEDTRQGGRLEGGGSFVAVLTTRPRLLHAPLLFCMYQVHCPFEYLSFFH